MRLFPTRPTRSALEHPRLWLAATCAASLLLAAGLPGLSIDRSGAVGPPGDDPRLLSTRLDALEFQEPGQVVLQIWPAPGAPRLDSAAGLSALDALIAGLRQVDGVDPERLPPPGVVAALTQGDRASLRTRANARRVRLSANGLEASLPIPLDPRFRNPIPGIEAWRGASQGALRSQLVGQGISRLRRARAGRNDVRRIALLASLPTAGVLALVLGIPAGLLVPLLSAAVVLAAVLGGAGWLGVQLEPESAVLPAFAVALAASSTVPLLEHLRSNLRSRSRTQVLLDAMDTWAAGVIALPLLLAVGFFASHSATEPWVGQLGLLCAAAAAVAAVLLIGPLPALLKVLPRTWLAAPGHESLHARIASYGAVGLERLGRLSARRPWLAIMAATLAILAVLPGIARLRVVPERGLQSVDLVVLAPGDWLESAAGHALIERASQTAAAVPGVEGVVSPLSLIALGEEPIGFVGRSGDSVRIRVLVDEHEREVGRRVQAALAARLRADTADAPVAYHFGGAVVKRGSLDRSLLEDGARGLAWTVLGSLALLALAFRRRRLALVALLPGAATTAVVYAAVGWLGEPVGYAAAFLPPVLAATGIAFATCWLVGYERERERFGAREAAECASIIETRRLRWTAVVLAGGFAAVATSPLHEARIAGAMLAGGTLLAWLFAHVLLPGAAAAAD